MMVKRYFVYILSDRHRGTLYTGVTGELEHRLAEHKSHSRPGFSNKYHADFLVYFEETTGVHAAIAREKQIKGWTRAKKVGLIESLNPEWRNLSTEVGAEIAEGRLAAPLPLDSFANRRIADRDAPRRSE